jgi:lipoprotein signal peptidase
MLWGHDVAHHQPHRAPRHRARDHRLRSRHQAGCDDHAGRRASALVSRRHGAYAQNTGGFLGLGADWPAPVRTGIFTVGTCILLLWLLAAASKRRWSPAAMLGITLFGAGAASNWIDRVLQGSVVDFLNVGIGPLRTGIFNVADVALMLGVALVVFTETRTRPATIPPCRP